MIIDIYFQRTTITIQRLVHEFSIYEWLRDIGDCISFKSPVAFSIGFSFFAKPGDGEAEIYIYVVRQLAATKFTCTSKRQFIGFVKTSFEKLPLSHYLEKSFIMTREDNPFYKSGFRPTQLVCSYIWIRK